MTFALTFSLIFTKANYGVGNSPLSFRDIWLRSTLSLKKKKKKSFEIRSVYSMMKSRKGQLILNFGHQHRFSQNQSSRTQKRYKSVIKISVSANKMQSVTWCSGSQRSQRLTALALNLSHFPPHPLPLHQQEKNCRQLCIT